MNEAERRQAELMKQRDDDTRRRIDAHEELTPQEELREAVRHSMERQEHEASQRRSGPIQVSGNTTSTRIVPIGAAALGIATVFLFSSDHIALAAVSGSIALLLGFWALYDRLTS